MRKEIKIMFNKSNVGNGSNQIFGRSNNLLIAQRFLNLEVFWKSL